MLIIWKNGIVWLWFWTTVVSDQEEDEPSPRDISLSPHDRAISPGPHLPTPEPAPSRARAIAHVRPISISDIVRDVAGPDPMRIIRDFDRVYMPEGCVAVNTEQCSCWATRQCSCWSHSAVVGHQELNVNSLTVLHVLGKSLVELHSRGEQLDLIRNFVTFLIFSIIPIYSGRFN